MSKDIDVKQLGTIGKSALHVLQKYVGFIFIIGTLLIYAFLVFRISTLAQMEPTEDAVLENTKNVKRLKLDQNSISKIEELEDQSIGVQSLFETARDNPFQD